MTTPTSKASRTRQPPPPPSTVLTISLQPDGSGSLVTQRGDLATIHQFEYHDLKDIVVAIQQGASHLVAIEKDPPPKDLPNVVTTTPSTPVRPETEEMPEADEDAPLNEQDGEATPAIDGLEAAIAAPTTETVSAMPLAGVTKPPPTAQLSLL